MPKSESYYYVDPETKRTVGPFSLTVLQKMKDSGLVTDKTEILREEDGKSRRFGDLKNVQSKSRQVFRIVITTVSVVFGLLGVGLVLLWFTTRGSVDKDRNIVNRVNQNLSSDVVSPPRSSSMGLSVPETGSTKCEMTDIIKTMEIARFVGYQGRLTKQIYNRLVSRRADAPFKLEYEQLLDVFHFSVDTTTITQLQEDSTKCVYQGDFQDNTGQVIEYKVTYPIPPWSHTVETIVTDRSLNDQFDLEEPIVVGCPDHGTIESVEFLSFLSSLAPKFTKDSVKVSLRSDKPFCTYWVEIFIRERANGTPRVLEHRSIYPSPPWSYRNTNPRVGW